MSGIRRHLDGGSVAVMAITLALFVAALVSKGLTHDLLLETGVFLVSVKLVIMTYKNGVATRELQDALGRISAALGRLEVSATPRPAAPTERADGVAAAAPFDRRPSGDKPATREAET